MAATSAHLPTQLEQQTPVGAPRLRALLASLRWVCGHKQHRSGDAQQRGTPVGGQAGVRQRQASFDARRVHPGRLLCTATADTAAASSRCAHRCACACSSACSGATHGVHHACSSACERKARQRAWRRGERWTRHRHVIKDAPVDGHSSCRLWPLRACRCTAPAAPLPLCRPGTALHPPGCSQSRPPAAHASLPLTERAV